MTQLQLGARHVMLTNTAWTDHTDVIVVGSGAAAFAAAITARQQGAAVLMLEKAAQIGGTTARAGGGTGDQRASTWIWIPNNPLMRAHGLVDPKPAALRYMARLARPQLYNATDPQLGLPADEFALIETFYDRGSEACDFLSTVGALQLGFRAGGLDYYSELPENAAPSGRAFYIRNDDESEGTGADLIRRMHSVATQQGIGVRCGQRVCRLLVDEGQRVVGVEGVDAAGTVQTIRARKGVIFASGGFTHNATLRHNFLPGPTVGGAAASSNEGDFIAIATSVGAALGNMNQAWFTPVILDHAPHTRSGAWKLPGDSMIVVNKYGVRVMNEKVTYNEMTRTFFAWDANRAEYPNQLLFMLYDQNVADRCWHLPEETQVTAGGGNPIPQRRAKDGGDGSDGHDGHELCGATWEELAAQIRQRLAAFADKTGGCQLAPDFVTQLAATLARFNHQAVQGIDPDFQRGAALIDRARNGPPRHAEMQNPTVHPFAASGPYYAVILAAGMLDTNGGPKINPNAQVIDVNGQPIDGLYGAGNCIASPAGQAYWGGGATLGLAITFGYLAGRHVTA